jgi:hypothetical protein
MMEAWQDTPYARVIEALSARGKLQRTGAGFLACCPAHGDRHPSLKVDRGTDGAVLLHCKTGCDFASIVSALGMRPADLIPSAKKLELRVVREEEELGPPVTLADIAAARKLPVTLLEAMGWRDAQSRGRACVEIPYDRADGTTHRVRVRRSLTGRRRFSWSPGDGLIAYDPDHGRRARELGYLVIVEGETDTATLLHSGFPALGIPSASMAKSITAEHLEGIETVYWVREPDTGGASMAKELEPRLRAVGFAGPVLEVPSPAGSKDVSALYVRDPDAFSAKFQEALDSARKAAEPKPLIEWRGTHELFAPLPPIPWRVRGLQICPGRPAMLAGYGASAKTLSAQSMALSCAAGAPVWAHFEPAAPMQVRHLDYEQGWYATARRYQRLAIGHGVDQRYIADRLKVAVFPAVYLDQPDAADAYARIADGVELIVLDALRGAAPTQDENDSSIRRCIDTLTRASEKTGCAFLILHHAGKPRADGQGDARTGPRGSSAIFDGCGSVFQAYAGQQPTDPRLVKHTKPPAESEGSPVPDFHLLVEDVPCGDNPTGGVRVVRHEVSPPDRVGEALERRQQRVAAILEYVRRVPGASQNAVAADVGGRAADAKQLIQELISKDVLALRIDGQTHRLYLGRSQWRPNGAG